MWIIKASSSGGWQPLCLYCGEKIYKENNQDHTIIDLPQLCSDGYNFGLCYSKYNSDGYNSALCYSKYSSGRYNSGLCYCKYSSDGYNSETLVWSRRYEHVRLHCMCYLKYQYDNDNTCEAIIIK